MDSTIKLIGVLLIGALVGVYLGGVYDAKNQ